MASLSAGDVVLGASAENHGLSLERVVINQHKNSKSINKLILLEHANGSLMLTPDHVLLIDGVFSPAYTAMPGSMLSLAGGSLASVKRVAYSWGTIINPVTASGTILATAHGEPIVALTHPEWSAGFMMKNPGYPLLFHIIAYEFPEITQSYYENVLEPLFDDIIAPHVKSTNLESSMLLQLAVVVADLGAVGCFACFVCVKNINILAVLSTIAVSIKLMYPAGLLQGTFPVVNEGFLKPT